MSNVNQPGFVEDPVGTLDFDVAHGVELHHSIWVYSSKYGRKFDNIKRIYALEITTEKWCFEVVYPPFQKKLHAQITGEHCK